MPSSRKDRLGRGLGIPDKLSSPTTAGTATMSNRSERCSPCVTIATSSGSNPREKNRLLRPLEPDEGPTPAPPPPPVWSAHPGPTREIAAEYAIPPSDFIPLKTVPPTFRAALPSSVWDTPNAPSDGRDRCCCAAKGMTSDPGRGAEEEANASK
jgi:hypothetical protein